MVQAQKSNNAWPTFVKGNANIHRFTDNVSLHHPFMFLYKSKTLVYVVDNGPCAITLSYRYNKPWLGQVWTSLHNLWRNLFVLVFKRATSAWAHLFKLDKKGAGVDNIIQGIPIPSFPTSDANAAVYTTLRPWRCEFSIYAVTHEPILSWSMTLKPFF